jgi:hypothetical protein
MTPCTSARTPAGHFPPMASRVPGPREQSTSVEVPREKAHFGNSGIPAIPAGIPIFISGRPSNIQLTASESMLRPSFRCKGPVNGLFVYKPLLATAFSWPSVRRRLGRRSEAKKRKGRTSQPAVSGIAAQLSARD